MINKEQITDILTLRYHPTKPTIPPLTVDDFTTTSNDTPEHNIELIDKMIKTTIKNNIKGDSISMALSGGVDSSLVLAKTREVFPKLDIHCISVGFYENDTDFVAAKNLAKAFDCEFHGLRIENPLKTLPLQVSITQEPRWNGYLSYVVEEAVKYSNMFVSGDGGDESFAGYVFRYKSFIESLDQNDGWMDRAVKYLNCHNRDWVPDQDKLFTPQMNFNWQDIYNKLKPSFDNSLDPINQILLADFNGKLLHDWIPNDQKLFKHFNVSGYAPLTNTDLVKFASYIPYYQKYNKDTNEGKIPLRRLLERTGHDDLLVKGKKGYAPDLERLWNNYGKPLCEKYLTENSDVIKHDMVNIDWINNAFERSQQNDFRYITKILSVLSLEIWCNLFVTKSIDKNTIL